MKQGMKPALSTLLKCPFPAIRLKIILGEYIGVKGSARITSAGVCACSHYLPIRDVSQGNLKRKIKCFNSSKCFSMEFCCFPHFLSAVSPSFLLLLRGFVWLVSLLKTDETKSHMDFSICK